MTLYTLRMQSKPGSRPSEFVDRAVHPVALERWESDGGALPPARDSHAADITGPARARAVAVPIPNRPSVTRAAASTTTSSPSTRHPATSTRIALATAPAHSHAT